MSADPPVVVRPSAPAGAPDAVRVWAGLQALVLDDDRHRAVADALGLSFGRVKALRRLLGAALTQRELAAALHTDAPHTTVIVHDLQARGLVTRSPHPVDRRAKVVALTAAGRAAAGRAEEILGTPPAGLARLDPAELVALERIVSKLLAG